MIITALAFVKYILFQLLYYTKSCYIQYYILEQGIITEFKFVVSGVDENEERKIGGIGLDELHKSFADSSGIAANQRMSSAGNRSLLAYFAKLGHSTDPEEMLDLDFVDSLLSHGASINTTDKHGQTLLHEVSKISRKHVS